MMAEVTAGWASVNAIAMWVMEMPASAEIFASDSTMSSFRWFSGRERSNWAAIESPRSRPRVARASGDSSNPSRR
jgi:hypothetical protein